MWELIGGAFRGRCHPALWAQGLTGSRRESRTLRTRKRTIVTPPSQGGFARRHLLSLSSVYKACFDLCAAQSVASVEGRSHWGLSRFEKEKKLFCHKFSR